MKKEILSFAISGFIFCSSQGAQAQQMTDKYIGEVFWTSANFCPQSSVLAAGQLLPMSAYNPLFTLLGYTYGGAGTQTFGVPDLRGKVSISQGAGPGLTAYTTGQSGGVETTIQNPRQAAFGVVLTDPTPVAVAKASTNADPAVAVNVPSFGGTGQSMPQENRQPYLVLTACIATSGIYPPRP